MVFATVKKTGSMMKPSFGVFMHEPPVHIEDCDSLELDNPAFRIEATLGGHFVILQVAIVLNDAVSIHLILVTTVI